MKDKLKYTEAVELATAFLGCDIYMPDKKDVLHNLATIYRINLLSFDCFQRTLIIERSTWYKAIHDLIPIHLQQAFRDGGHNDRRFIQTLRDQRHIGRNIGRDCICNVDKTIKQAGAIEDNS